MTMNYLNEDGILDIRRLKDLDDRAAKQIIFNYVAKHLQTQGVAAVDESGDCQYRASDGKMCAVGCLIPNDLYNEKMEGHGAEFIAVCIDDEDFHSALDRHERLLVALQVVHDRWLNSVNAEDRARVQKALDLVATCFDLIAWRGRHA